MHMVDRHWGARGHGAYACRSLLDAGTRLAFGSDAPVEDMNPFVGLHAAVTRRRADGSPGPDGWYADQRLDILDALRAYTIDAAWSCGREREIGRLAPGWLADFVILDTDILEIEPHEVRSVKPVAVRIGGQTPSPPGRGLG
jgi:hypothetical protein